VAAALKVKRMQSLLCEQELRFKTQSRRLQSDSFQFDFVPMESHFYVADACAEELATAYVRKIMTLSAAFAVDAWS
jgi:hypothetical protein